MPDTELWIPVKDKGIDFLATKPNQKQPISIQVKMSRDYTPNVAFTTFEKSLVAGGWFTFNHKKLAESKADIWSLVLVSRDRRSEPHFINIPPKTLLSLLIAVFGKQKSYNSYPWVLSLNKKENVCIEGRRLLLADKQNLATKGLSNYANRDLTEYYENWDAFNN